MKLAIHDDSGSFSSRWITYCQENNINFKKVNCYYGKRYYTSGAVDSLYFSSADGVIRLALPTNNKVFVQ